MLPTTRFGEPGTKLFLLHWLSGSARVWTEVGTMLEERRVACVAFDLPGFGEASNVAGFDIEAMSKAVIESIATARAGCEDEPWLLAGHSMGGTVAAVVARAAVDGHKGLGNLRGVLLFSPSPPGPEPMKQSKREQMLESLGERAGDLNEDRKRASQFIDDNTGKLALSEVVRERAVDDVLRMNRTAFRAWLEHGSKEDWRDYIGKLPVPALIFAGVEDQALGPKVQQDQTLPHFGSGAVVVLEGAGHLAPMERPREVVEHTCEFVRDIGFVLPSPLQPSERFAGLIASQKTSVGTRTVLQERAVRAGDWNYKPSILNAEQFRTLRALADQVVPRARFDIAAGVEERLTSNNGDGWRFAKLPNDVEAWRRGLHSLDVAAKHAYGATFVSLHETQRDELLQKASEGSLGRSLLNALHMGEGADAFSATEMKLWFEEVRADLTKCYMSHPAVLERISFTGFADESGFTQIRIGQLEEFER